MCHHREVVHMLRIDPLKNGARHVAYALSGRIDASHLPELDLLIARALATGRSISFDLSAVTLIDRDTARFFSSGKGRRARLDGCPPYIEQWVQSETRIR
jgi:anti-anti-sigma regulatory factor